MTHRTRAIKILAPNSSYNSDGNTIIKWLTPDVTQPTETEIQAKIAELEAEYDANQYQRDRHYPPVGDQLDDLYHAGVFSAEMMAKLKKVKDDNPKP